MNKNCINCKHYLREDRLCICLGSRHCSDVVGDYRGCEKFEAPKGCWECRYQCVRGPGRGDYCFCVVNGKRIADGKEDWCPIQRNEVR